MKKVIVLSLLAAVCAVPTLAQDSTATPLFSGLGDALERQLLNEQVNTFVVDTEAIQSSWENGFRVAPLLKGSKPQTGDYRTNLMSMQAASKAQIFDTSFPFSNYSVWNVPGAGVNDFANDPNNVTTVNMTGKTGHQFAVGFTEFGSPEMTNIIGGIVNYEPSDPTRLYVARVITAVNGFAESDNRSQIALGAVDASGNVHFRADDDRGSLLGPLPISGNNYYRVDMLGRSNNTLNIIDLFTGISPDPNGFYRDPAATEWLLSNYANVATCPSIIPEELTDTVRPVLLGANFASQYGREGVAGTVAFEAYLPSGSPDHRGNVSFTPFARCVSGSVGTVGTLWKNSSFATVQLGLTEVDADGAILSQTAYTVPSVFSNLPPNNATFGGGANGIEFDHYHSQTAFSGGPQVAVGQDAAGRTLAAGPVYDLNAMDDNYLNPYNGIAVVRSDCGANPAWTLAAYIAQTNNAGTPDDPTDDTWDGSAVYGGANGSMVIGRLAPYYALPFTARTGPSMSGPAMDAAGNIYFLSTFERFSPSEVNSGLFRAVYDPATFSYKLELVLEYNQIFTGQNSGVSYQIQDIRINDSNSVDSGTLWSGNIVQTAFGGLDVASLDAGDPRALGGLVLQTNVVYDTNNDGSYNGGIGSPDESYNVLFVVLPDGEIGPTLCPGDANCDGFINFRDIDYFVAAQNDNVAAWEALFGGSAPCDFLNNDTNGDGFVNFRDIDPFVALQNTTCP